MKKHFLFIMLIAVSITSCGQTKKDSDSNKQPEMIVKDADHNFGEIEFAGNGTHQFVFKNTGKVPLIITKVSSSCGCTTPEWSKEPIKPRKKGEITVRYDTKRVGSFVKNVTVYSNAKNSPVTMIIRGSVKAKVEEENATE